VCKGNKKYFQPNYFEKNAENFSQRLSGLQHLHLVGLFGRRAHKKTSYCQGDLHEVKIHEKQEEH